MVAGISSGISAYSSLFENIQTNFKNSTNDISSNSFENIMNNAQNTPDVISSDDMQLCGEQGSSSKNSNDMDLNKDGQITIDEIMKYMELQMQNEENLTSNEMQGENNSQNNNSNFQGFKTPISQVIKAYSTFI